MFDWLFLTLLFLTVTVLTFALYAWVLERRHRAEARARGADEPVGADRSAMILGSLTPLLAEQSPIAADKKSEMRQELRQAGYYHPSALTEYQAIRAVLVGLPILVSGVLGLLAPREEIPRVAIIGGVLAGLGFSVPRLYVNYLARRRAVQIERGLPVAVDLLNLGLSGGQNIHAALLNVAREVHYSFPVLADELQIVREQAELSRLNLALQHFADRTGHPDVRNLTMVLTQTERLGTDISAGLLEYANSLRTNMRHRAEAQANRASFWMIFPTILFLWIPAVVVLFAPAYHEMTVRRNAFREALGSGKTVVESVNTSSRRSVAFPNLMKLKTNPNPEQ